MIGHGIVPRNLRPARDVDGLSPADEPLARGIRQVCSRVTTGVVSGTRRLVSGSVDVAQGAVDAVRTNRWGISDFLVGLGATIMVSSDRVGYIRRYVDGRAAEARALEASAAEDAAEAAATAMARAAALGAMVAAGRTLSRFVRRTVFIQAAAANAAVPSSSPNRVTLTHMVGVFHNDGDSANYVNAVRDNQPRLRVLPDRTSMIIGRANYAACKAVEGNSPPPPPPAGPPTPPGPAPLNGGGAVPQQVSVFQRGPLFNGRCAWKDQMEDDERAAEGVAQFLSVGTNGEADVTFMSGQDFWTRLLNRYYVRRKSYHRASNKFCKRLRLLRVLREDMIFTGIGHKRERTALNLAAAEELAKKVVTKAIDSGTIPARDARWFKNGLVETYFIRDDDDTFWAGLAAAPQAVRA